MIKVLQIMASMNAGGVETLFHNYYKHMDKSRFHFDVACYAFSEGVYREKYEELGCKVYSLPSKKKVIWSFLELKRILDKGEYDIIHVNLDDKSLIPIIAAWFSKIPIRIIHTHVGNYSGVVPMFYRLFFRKLIILFATDHFACSNKAGKEFYGKNASPFIMKNGIDYSQFKYSDELRIAIRNYYSFDKKNKVIGNVARLAEQKNPIFLLKIFEELVKIDDSYRLLLVGGGYYKDFLAEYIDRKNLTKYVVLAGAKVDAYKYYNALDMFVLPSLYEGLGISFLESQVNGLITIASTNVPKETKISNNIVYLPLNSSTRAWAEHIDNTMKSRDSEDTINQSYNIQNATIELERKYCSLVKKRGTYVG